MKKLLTVLVLAALVCSLSGCGIGFGGWDFGFGSSFVYDHASKYTIGDGKVDGKVKNIDIDWLSGSVSVVTGSGDSVVITEATTGKIDKDMRVHWWLDGTTLRIKFCASGLKMRFNCGKKELTVSVPESISLSDISVDSASGDVNVLDVNAEALRVDTASGDILVDTACELKEIRTDTASGDQSISVRNAQAANLDAASGRISVSADSIRRLHIDTASGNVRCDLQKEPDDCRIETASGLVEVTLPEAAGFTLKLSTASGRLTSDFAMKKSGNTYVCGSGSGRLDIDTASGIISLVAV